jgi:hypothetical protein
MSTTFRDFKRGTTFDFVGMAVLPAGVWSATCQLRTEKGLLGGTLTVTVTPDADPAKPSSVRLLAEAADTKTWPLGLLYGDILFADGAGVVLATSDFSINVIASRTTTP